MTDAGRPRPPSVDHVLGLVRGELEASEPDALTRIARDVVAWERDRLAAGLAAAPDQELAAELVHRVEDFDDPELTIPPPAINATGVILHTNLGRAPWPEAARRAATLAASGYGYLELDPATGRRGPRFRAGEDHLVALTGAEDALVVTNNAAALLLAVGLAGRRGAVVVSRGELVEIGGGVRIPEVVARAGARLIEVGTTNRTRAADFEAPLAEGRASVVLRVHPSNFAIHGFTESADLAEVAAVAHRHAAVVVDDLGSGALLDTAELGLAHEPTPAERLAAGADVVLFSADKLVGGPQAGLLVGRADLIARMRRDPLARAIRPDKSILAGVAATLAIYRAGRARRDIPVWRTIAREVGELRERAEWIVERCRGGDAGTPVRIVDTHSTVGGGSLPGQTLPSVGLAVACASPTRAAATLRGGVPRILARVDDGALVLDLRTVERVDDGHLVLAILGIAGGR